MITYKSYAHKGTILCIYCHNLHKQVELVNGICPKMQPFALQEHLKYSYVCSKCQGEGAFQQIVETRLIKTAKRQYQEKWKQWFQKNRDNEVLSSPPEIQKKIISTTVKSTQIVCDECNGQGKIFRLAIDKNKPYLQNQYSLNPVWIKYRMNPTTVQNPFSCLLCCSQVKLLDKSFRLGCGHQFHSECIFNYLKESSQCPECKQVDQYVKVEVDKEIESDSCWGEDLSLNQISRNTRINLAIQMNQNLSYSAIIQQIQQEELL